ncbi:DUF2628 domain-containing protein [Limnobaculum parvum]|uniref:DUF2628 domain-containing protein n=1 Tax=Limnobaculum parvum TaxID=2172103 RepID=UPI0038B40230
MYGAPNTPEHKAALSAEKVTRQISLSLNFIAFFFGFIYFFKLGLWKKNLVIIVIFMMINSITDSFGLRTGSSLSQVLSDGINIVSLLMWSVTANYAYYLKEVKGRDGWNPFEGIF